MKQTLEQLRHMLQEGVRLSRQTSYARQAPAPESLRLLSKVRSGLADFVESHPADAQAWDLLARAEECLLHYSDAQRCLETAMRLSGVRSKSDLKRLAMYRQMQAKWQGLGVTPAQLSELGKYLRRKLSAEPGGRTFKWTEKWLHENGFADTSSVLAAFRARGVFDDFQASENLARGMS